MGWIRIRMDPELLPGSESGTRENSKLDPDPEYLIPDPQH